MRSEAPRWNVWIDNGEAWPADEIPPADHEGYAPSAWQAADFYADELANDDCANEFTLIVQRADGTGEIKSFDYFLEVHATRGPSRTVTLARLRDEPEVSDAG